MTIGIYFNYSERGPGKVISNLIKGLNLIGINCVINNDGDKNIILQNCNRLNGDLSNCILGPNICTLPIDNNIIMDHNRYESLIVPSDWVKNLYMKWIPSDKIKVWPVGIDTDLFSDKSKDKKEYDFLVYFKRRSTDELNLFLNKLRLLNKKFNVIEYGKYNESQFIDLISKSKFGAVIDNCESQGIAIEEMMSCNLPLLVWDVKHWIDRGVENKCESTSIPYWNDMCGEVFYDSCDIEDKIKKIEVGQYNPRNFIIDNLSIQEQSKKIFSL